MQILLIISSRVFITISIDICRLYSILFHDFLSFSKKDQTNQGAQSTPEAPVTAAVASAARCVAPRRSGRPLSPRHGFGIRQGKRGALSVRWSRWGCLMYRKLKVWQMVPTFHIPPKLTNFAIAYYLVVGTTCITWTKETSLLHRPPPIESDDALAPAPRRRPASAVPSLRSTGGEGFGWRFQVVFEGSVKVL